jgi:hypothetical protein
VATLRGSYLAPGATKKKREYHMVDRWTSQVNYDDFANKGKP